MKKICPFCKASLPQEASFCPYCAHSLSPRVRPKRPFSFPLHILRVAVIGAAVGVLGMAAFCLLCPGNYVGMGTVIYTDQDGTYQLISNVSTDRYYPMTEILQDAGNQESYRFPLRLYINHKDTGADASGIFTQKIDHVQLKIEQPSDSPSPVIASIPDHGDDYPGTALISYIDYSRLSYGPIQLIWNLYMSNHDTIRIASKLVITPVNTYQYSSRNEDLSDSRALQDLIDHLARETNRKDIINIELPAVTYKEPITLHSRAFNLIGTKSDKQRTTFTAGIQVQPPENGDDGLSCLYGIDFIGNGDGVGISSANEIRIQDCRFSHWKTALFGYDDAWINPIGCIFENNETGLYYNIAGGSYDDTRFTDNVFQNNITAVVLESVATDIQMDFSGCFFKNNQTNIDNRCQQSVNIREAVFQ